MLVVPAIGCTVWLAAKGRVEAHRWWARRTFGVCLYVTLTGLVIYGMNEWVRPV